MNGFLVIGLLCAVALAFVLWRHLRDRRTKKRPPPTTEATASKSDHGPVVPTKPLYQVREGGDGGGNG